MHDKTPLDSLLHPNHSGPAIINRIKVHTLTQMAGCGQVSPLYFSSATMSTAHVCITQAWCTVSYFLHTCNFMTASSVFHTPETTCIHTWALLTNGPKESFKTPLHILHINIHTWTVAHVSKEFKQGCYNTIYACALNQWRQDAEPLQRWAPSTSEPPDCLLCISNVWTWTTRALMARFLLPAAVLQQPTVAI